VLRVRTQVRQLVQRAADLLEKQQRREASEDGGQPQPPTRRQPAERTDG
jgi:hypothetical protein